MKKTFAYVQNAEIPGVRAHSIFVVKTCQAANQLGLKTYLICPKKVNPEYQASDDLWSYYQIKQNSFTYIRINNFYFTLAKFLNRLFKSLSHQIISFLFALFSWFYLYQRKIAIVQTSDPEVILVMRLLSIFYQPKIIYDVHLDPPRWLGRSILRKVNLIVCNSKYFKNCLLRRGIDKRKVIQLANGYDPNDYPLIKSKKNLRRRLKLPENRFIIGYVGRLITLDQEKGLDILLTTASRLAKQLSLTVIIIGGPKSMVKKYQRLAKELGLTSKQAIIRDQIKPGLVADYIQSFDLAWLVYPNLPHYQHKMSPMKVIEYMAAVKPIIASDFPSVKELLNQKSAYLVNPENTDQIIKTIRQIFKNPKLAIQKAQKANQFIKNLSWLDRQRRVLEQL